MEWSDASLMATLRGHAIFDALDAIEAETLAGAGSLLYLQGGAELFAAGDPPDGFYVVLEGALQVEVEGQRVAQIGFGEAVGEMGLVTADRRSATVRAIAGGVVWHLGGRGFEALLSAGDPIATGILLGIARDLCRRFRAVVDEAAELVPSVAQVPGGLDLVDSLQWADFG